MVITPRVIVPTLLMPLIAYWIYRRARSNFGNQPIQPRRMMFRVVLFAAIGSMLMWTTLHSLVLLATAFCRYRVGRRPRCARPAPHHVAHG